MARKKKEAPKSTHNWVLSGDEQKRLRNVVERIERLEENKKEIAEDIKDIYTEARENGLVPKAIREVIKLRKMEKEVRELQEHLVDAYKLALGMLADLPLGEAAVVREFGDKVTPLEEKIKQQKAADARAFDETPPEAA